MSDICIIDIKFIANIMWVKFSLIFFWAKLFSYSALPTWLQKVIHVEWMEEGEWIVESEAGTDDQGTVDVLGRQRTASGPTVLACRWLAASSVWREGLLLLPFWDGGVAVARGMSYDCTSEC